MRRFRPEFLYFYLCNSDWLHTGHVSELAEHTMPENFGDTEDSVSGKSFEEVNFYTGIKSKYPRNRIIFGAREQEKVLLLMERQRNS